jgi:hypothetical protein
MTLIPKYHYHDTVLFVLPDNDTEYRMYKGVIHDVFEIAGNDENGHSEEVTYYVSVYDGETEYTTSVKEWQIIKKIPRES